MAHTIILSVFVLVSAVCLYLSSYKMLQIFQLSSYRNREVISWLKRTHFDYLARYFSLAFFGFVPTALFVACFGKYDFVQYLGFIFYALLCVAFFLITSRQSKPKLKFTKRVIRLSVLLFIIYATISFPLIFLLKNFFLQYSFVSLVPFFIPILTMLSVALISPLESLICAHFKTKAAKKLADHPNLIKIGITGSYGKTTAKNILHAFLSQKYKVCSSPKSYNTPMGLSKVINESLDDSHEVLICEMGARYKGDIKELSRLINPNIGILTAIGDMHLETFGSKETLIDTKYELIKSLGDGGTSVFCGKDPIMKTLFDKTTGNKLITMCDDSKIKCFYSSVSFSSQGTSFDLTINDEAVSITTELLGKHIPSMIALCALVAFKLGVSLREIAETAKTLKPVPHRLELIRRGNTTVIDDAYNSNPVGAENALEILSCFDGDKIVITPGFVELGERSSELHAQLGSQIEAAASHAILIGKNASLIKQGMQSFGNVFIVNSLQEAMKQLEGISSDKKTILFMNDLPDNF